MPKPTWENLAPERRERVLNAAMREFGRAGYSGGSLNVIAREAGVAKGSLFQYFTDKFDFFAYVSVSAAGRVRAHMEPWLQMPPAGVAYVDFFVEAIEAWVSYFASHPLERGVTVATNLEIDPTVRAAVRTPINQIYVESLRPLLEQARDRGELYPDADLEVLLSVLLVLLPHLAIAPFEPGLDPVGRLYGKSVAELREPLRELVASAFARFGPVPEPAPAEVGHASASARS